MDAARWKVRSSALALAFLALAISGPWGGGAPAPRPGPRAGISGDAQRGARLFGALDCARCHSEPRRDRQVQVPPALDIEGSRANPEWLAEYVLAPHPLRYVREGIRGNLRMPALVASKADARDLAALMATWTDTVRVPPFNVAVSDSIVREGASLFAQYQCRGCHELGGEGRKVGPALDGVGDRRPPQYFRTLLVDPGRVVPGTSMKNFDLWSEEADAMTAFLSTLGGSSASELGPFRGAEYPAWPR